MKKFLLLALLLASLAPAAHAQVFGQYTPAEILPVNSREAGAYLDFGFQGGLARLDWGSSTKTALRLGADLRFGVAKANPSFPVNVAVGGGLGVETSDNYTVLRLGPSAVASRAFALSGSTSVVPFAGVMLCFASVDRGEKNETDFSVPVRLGAELRAIPGMHITAEFQLRIGDDFNDHSAFAAGVNLPF
jgi:opacity protein-like surface antigen